jgi:hypothetical protein
MATRILALTKDDLGTSRIYTGLDAVPNGLVSSFNEAHVYERTAINPFAPLKMAVAGNNQLAVSVDGGDNWNSIVLGVPGVVRQLQWVNSTSLYILTETALLRSTDSGATVVGIPFSLLPLDAGKCMDMVWTSLTNGVLIRAVNPITLTGGAYTYRTTDGGTTWNVHPIPALIPDEAPRRIAAYDGSLNELLFLTSGRLRYLIGTDPLLAYTGTPVSWNFNVELITLFPGYPPSGYDGVLGVDNNNRFDDIVVKGTKVWLGGYNALRAHGQIALPFASGQTMYITDPALATPALSLVDYYTHSAIGANNVFAGSSQPGSSLFPYRPGLNFSSDGGISTSPFQVFPGTQRLVHHAALAEDPIAGCTDPQSCNYDAGVNTDDGSCSDAVQLVNCETNAIIYTATPSIARLRCHNPRSIVSVQLLDPAIGTQVIGITVNGTLVINYGASISTSLLPSERLEAFIGGLVFFINSTTSFRAKRIQPSANPIVPGGIGAFYLESSNPSDASVSCAAFSLGLLGVTASEFSNLYPGAIVRVEEYPDQCFRVCGDGDCLATQPLRLVSSHVTCTDCLPLDTTRICMDCSTQLSVNDIPISANCTGCVSAGNSLSFAIRAQFPDYVQEVIIPLEAGTEPGSGCPLTLSFSGDRRILFPVGSTITVTSGDQEQYTVATVVYDGGSNITTVTTQEAFGETGDLIEVVAFTNCSCSVRVLVQRVDAQTGLLSMVYDQSFNCVGGLVEQNIDLLIEQYGRYQVTIEAQDCAGAKTCRYTLDACNGFKVTRTDCHTYVIGLNRPSNALNTGQFYQVEIRDLSDNTVLLNQAVADDDFPFKFINDSDTVYLITVTAPGGQVWKTEVIDLCDMENCKLRLANAIFCNSDLCATPVQSQASDLSRNELVRMSILSREIEAAVFSLRYRWTGIPNYGPAQLQDLEMLARTIATLRISSQRCADCPPLSTTTTPCATC